MNYDAEYIRELTAARKANEVARARLKDQDETIVALRAELDEGKGYLTRLLLAIVPACVPFKELPLLATQIDHVYAGQRAELDALRARIAELEAKYASRT